MKVLYLTNLPSPYRVDFFNELGKLCDLTVIYERESASNRNSKWLGSRGKTYNEVFLKSLKIGDESSICPTIFKWIRADYYDQIIIGGYSTPTSMLAIEYLKITGKNFILNSDGGFVKDDNKLKKLIKTHFISSAKYYLSTSKMTSDYLIHYGAKKECIFQYPFTSIVESDILTEMISINKKTEIKKALNIEDEFVILSIGQFIYRKGFDVLINAASQLNEKVGVYIIGGQPIEEYKRIIQENNIRNIHFVDFQTKSNIAKYYMAADVFVLPTREDIWGLVINEAMAYGLPVITTNKCIAGVSMIRNGENGYVVDINKPQELASSINRIYNNPEKCFEMGNFNLRLIKNYTIEAMARRHFEILSKLEGDHK